MKRLNVAYIRTSTNKQDLGLEVQRDKINQYATLKDFKNVIFYEEQESGKTFNRTQLNKVLDLIKAGNVENFVVYKLDRLGRNLVEINQFIELCNKHNTNLIGVVENFDTQSAAGRMVINIMASFAQYERELISERTSQALQQKKSKREKYCSQAPFGYKFEANTMVVNREEQVVLERIKLLRSEGLSVRAITEKLTQDGYKNRAKKHYGVSSVGEIVKGL